VPGQGALIAEGDLLHMAVDRAALDDTRNAVRLLAEEAQ